MIDPTFNTTDQTAAPASRTSKAQVNAKDITDQARSAGRDLKDKAADLAETSAAVIKDQASDLVDATKDVASQATDKLKQTIDSQKNASAEYVGSLADTIRRAAQEFDQDLPIAGTYIRKAAAQVENAGDLIKSGNFNDLVRGAQSFARRQPTAFLGMAVLAGFGVVRFMKSSGKDVEKSESRPNRTNTERANGGSATKGYRDDFAQ